MEDDLTCPISLQQLKEPISTPCCGQVFSRISLTEWFSNKEKITCPICTGDISYFDPINAPTVKLIARMIEARNKDDGSSKEKDSFESTTKYSASDFRSAVKDDFARAVAFESATKATVMPKFHSEDPQNNPTKNSGVILDGQVLKSELNSKSFHWNSVPVSELNSVEHKSSTEPFVNHEPFVKDPYTKHRWDYKLENYRKEKIMNQENFSCAINTIFLRVMVNFIRNLPPNQRAKKMTFEVDSFHHLTFCLEGTELIWTYRLQNYSDSKFKKYHEPVTCIKHVGIPTEAFIGLFPDVYGKDCAHDVCFIELTKNVFIIQRKLYGETIEQRVYK